MKQSLSFRPRSRILRAILAAWMTVFAMAEAVHTHGPLVAGTNQSSLAQPAAGGIQRDICLACLASHTPVPAADAPAALLAPQEEKAILPVGDEGSLRCDLFPSLTSRAPPALSTPEA